jgi:hypothetical protein
VQTGIAFEFSREYEQGAGMPPEVVAALKHLRTGINVVMADTGSLVRLLIRKGVITEEEYATSIVDGMQQEVLRAQQSIFNTYGLRVVLS